MILLFALTISTLGGLHPYAAAGVAAMLPLLFHEYTLNFSGLARMD
jgi:hypothetical protein